MFSHPADYTPVCTTELARVAQLFPEFDRRNVKPIALSCDNVESHLGWIKDIMSYASNLFYFVNVLKSICWYDFQSELSDFPYPIIDDEKRQLAVKLNMLDMDEIGAAGVPLTCRAVFIIDPLKKLRLSLLYPASTGRNFEWALYYNLACSKCTWYDFSSEILRVLDALQLTDKNKVATPADWKVLFYETIIEYPWILIFVYREERNVWCFRQLRRKSYQLYSHKVFKLGICHRDELTCVKPRLAV